MAQAKDGDNVKIHYSGSLNDGTVFDTSSGRDPLEFVLGSGMVIPGFDKAVSGMAPGESKKVTIPCDEAYGDRNDEMIYVVDKAELPQGIDPEPGMALEAQGPDGQPFRLNVTAVDGDKVTLDANHPLAGQDLTFEIELVEIG